MSSTLLQQAGDYSLAHETTDIPMDPGNLEGLTETFQMVQVDSVILSYDYPAQVFSVTLTRPLPGTKAAGERLP